jgi:hypothetical protein
MIRRNFLSLLSALPLLGFLKPQPKQPRQTQAERAVLAAKSGLIVAYVVASWEGRSDEWRDTIRFPNGGRLYPASPDGRTARGGRFHAAYIDEWANITPQLIQTFAPACERIHLPDGSVV